VSFLHRLILMMEASRQQLVLGFVLVVVYFPQTLHFFNTPPNIAENEMRDVFTDAKAPRPKAIKFFQSKSKAITPQNNSKRNNTIIGTFKLTHSISSFV